MNINIDKIAQAIKCTYTDKQIAALVLKDESLLNMAFRETVAHAAQLHVQDAYITSGTGRIRVHVQLFDGTRFSFILFH